MRAMNPERYPHLSALAGRGPAAYTGDCCSYLLVEVRGGRLYIAGATPFRERRGRWFCSGEEYCYILDSEAAEALLTALSRANRDRPERALAENFELARPDYPLGKYLDRLRLDYRYEVTEGELS